jgi:hypothetical protein
MKRSTVKTSKAKSAKSKFWIKGQLYFIRTVTMYLVGELVDIDEHEILLNDAAWVADTGRFNEMLRTGKCHEVEPCPDGLAVVGRGALVDAYPWAHGYLRIVV